MEGLLSDIFTSVMLFIIGIIGMLVLFSVIPSICLSNSIRKENEKKLLEELNNKNCFVRLFLPQLTVFKSVALKLFGPFTLGANCKLKVFISDSGRPNDWDYFGASTYGIITLLNRSNYLSLTIDSQLNNSKSYIVTYFYAPTNLIESRDFKQIEQQQLYNQINKE